MSSHLDKDLARIRELLHPLDQWACQCHGASAKIVKSGILETARVARGTCTGVGGQHSWVVVGMDCYDEQALIIDPTLWSYDDSVQGIWTGTMQDDGKHRPHGTGSIWEWGRPNEAAPGKAMELTPKEPFSDRTRDFLDMLGPLDEQGWRTLAHAPVEGWPAHEILPAINDTLGPWVPIDIIGMITDRNPGGLYLPGDERSEP